MRDKEQKVKYIDGRWCDTVNECYLNNGWYVAMIVPATTKTQTGAYVVLEREKEPEIPEEPETPENPIVPEKPEENINGFAYVDLGLPSGLKWATHNIGAASPNERGDYFAWGEINTKAEFTEMTCTSYGLNMQDIAGDPQYDAARANWGATWKVPSKKDFEELMNECTWEWMVINGKGCKKVTGPNGNYIILPITGYQYGTSFYMEDFGYYWTSTPISTYEQFSYDFFFDEEEY